MEDEINLKDIFDVLFRQKAAVAWFFVLCVAVSLIISFTMKPLYEGKTQLLIRASGSSAASQMAGLASMMGMSLGGGSGGGSISEIEELMQTPAVERRVKEILSSHPSLEGVSIEEYDLGKLKTKSKGSILNISVRHENPVLSAAISDAYVQAVSYYWNRLNVTEARRKREYLEVQIPIAEAELDKAQNKLKSLTYLIAPSKNLVGGQGIKTIDILRLEKEMEIQASIYQMLRTEYAGAKVQEAKEVSPFSDIEKAEVPLSPVVPNKKLNLAVGMLFGLFGGVFFAFLKDYFQAAYKK